MKDQYLVRDEKSRAVLNTDLDGLKLYKKKKARDRETKTRLNTIEAELKELKELIFNMRNKT